MPTRLARGLAALLLCSLLATPAVADEGMWPFDHVPVEALRAKYGVTLTNEWLHHLQLSTARLTGSCTGSFVSPDGLVLTNHHCAQEAIVEHSTASSDLLKHGFLARTRAEELPCSSIEITSLVGMEDVTAKVLAATRGLDDQAANEARKRVLSELELASEAASRRDPKTGPLFCEAVTLYHGGQYLIYRYKRYSDVRLVFAPEYDIADFGGDPDNFQFPRWCLDMALLRVYENGQPAKIANWLRIDVAGAREGDPTFVAGHPGTTERTLTMAELSRERGVTLPLRTLLDSELRGRLIQFGKTGDEANRQIQDELLDLENGLKARRALLTALNDDSMLTVKAHDEQALRARVDADPALRASAGHAWDEIGAAQRIASGMEVRYDLLEHRRAFHGHLMAWARTIVRGTAERAKPNGERLREYAESALPFVEQRLVAPAPAYPAVEQLEIAFDLERLREYLGIDDPLVKSLLGADTPDAVAARLVRGTKLGDPAFRAALWKGGAAAVAASDDPLVAFARTIEPEARALRTRWDDAVEAPTTRGSEAIARARFAVYGANLYPDATLTLRLNDGRVAGWSEGGRTIAPFTTVGEAFARATGADPLILPPAWLAARGALDPATPFNLATTNDIVGGNSGSPMVNAKGDLVGLVFDGNFPSIAGDYWFDIRDNRCVAVHTALIKAALVNVYKADALAKELGFTK